MFTCDFCVCICRKEWVPSKWVHLPILCITTETMLNSGARVRRWRKRKRNVWAKLLLSCNRDVTAIISKVKKQIPGWQLTITVEVLWTSEYQMHGEKQIQQLNLVVDLLCCPTAEPHQMLMLQWHGPHHVELSRLCLCLVCESVQTWSKLACLRLQLLWRWGQVIVSILNVKTCKEFFKKRILGNYWQYTLLQEINNIIEGWLIVGCYSTSRIHSHLQFIEDELFRELFTK